MYTIYQAVHKPSNKVYIGVTSNSLDARIAQHYRVKERIAYEFQIYLKVTEKDEWIWTILEQIEDKSEAFRKESEFIRLIHKDFTLNSTIGRRMIVKHEWQFRKEHEPYMKGKLHSEATKEKMRRAHANRPPRNPNWTDEQKKHLQLAQKDRKELLCVELDRVFLSISDASKQLGIPRPNIRKVLNGERKSAKGYTFKLVEKEI